MCYLNPNSVGKDKLDSRWENGIFVGLREESGEIFVMSEEGVIKVRSYNRRCEEERWNQEEFNKGKGTPWEPIPGEGPIQVKSRFKIKDRPEDEAPLKAPEIREAKPRRIYISNQTSANITTPQGAKDASLPIEAR